MRSVHLYLEDNIKTETQKKSEESKTEYQEQSQSY